MKILNNKYSIINSIDTNENIYEYKVKDISNNEIYNLYIFKDNVEYESCRNYLLSKFKTIKNLNFKNVVNILNLEIIKNVDKVNLEKLNYGYITEHIENSISTIEYFNKCSFFQRLDLFMELCTAINTLNIKGYIFNEINIKDICIILDKEKKPTIKIKNLLQYEINKFKESNKSISKLIPYPYNIENIDDESTEKDNVKDILYLFENLFTECELKKYIEKDMSIEKILLFNKSNKISDFIKWINKKLNKDYELFVFEALNNVNNDLDIIGMEDEINKVELDFENIYNNKLKSKIICFQGEDGNGKTKTLKEIKKRICSKYIENKIENSYTILDNLNGTDLCIKNLKKIFDNSEKYLKDKYGMYFKKFINMLINNDIDGTYKTFQIVNRMCALLHEYTLNNILFFIIDDIEKTSNIFKLFFKHMCIFENQLENIIVVLSSNEENFNSNMIEYMNSIKKIQNYEEISVNYFNNYNTSEMVKNMLNYDKSIDELCMKIYSETLGKPQFICKTIEELYNKNILYLSKEDGKWKSNIDLDNIVIPKGVEKILESKILNLSNEELEVLQRLSIFKFPLSENLILSYVILDKEKQNIYFKLKKDRFLIDKISDEGVRVDFYNDLVKKIIYFKIPKKERMVIHNEYCCFLENILKNTQEYLDEFLNQLEKSNQQEKLIKYSLKCGRKFDNLGDTFKSIDYYKKALKYAQCENKTRISISIAKLNEKVGKDKEAYKYFSKSNEYAVENEQFKFQIYSLIRMIILSAREHKAIDLTFPLKIVRDLLDKTDYTKGEAYYYYSLALIDKMHGEKDKAVNYLEKVFEICNINNIKVGVYACSKVLLSSILMSKGNYNDAKKLLYQSMKIFQIENNYAGLLTVKINNELINKEIGNNIQNVLNNLIEIRKLSNKYKVYKKEVSSLIKISKINIETFKYQKACKNLLVALKIAKENDLVKYILEICTLLCLVYCKLGEIKLASYYYELMSDLKNDVQISELEMLNISSTDALYNATIYNFKYAFDKLSIINNLKNKYKNSGFSNIKSQYYQLKILNCDSECDVKDNFELLKSELNELKNPILKSHRLATSILSILFLRDIKLARELFFYNKNDLNEKSNQLLYSILELYFTEDNENLINKLLNIVKAKKNDEIKAVVYYSIAEKYNKKQCFELAINYYYESINIFIDLINSLPENIKLKYINNSLFLTIYNKFITLILDKADVNLNKIENIKSNSEIDEILKKLSITNLILNKEFLNIMENAYSKRCKNPIRSLHEILHGFSNDIVENLESLLKYIARLTLSNSALLIVEDNLGEDKAICKYGMNDCEKIKKYIGLKGEYNKDIITLCNNYECKNSLSRELLNDKVQACMYIKLRNRKRFLNNNECINGSIILISNNAINNINSNSEKIVKKLIPFILFLLNQYKVVISSTLDKLTGIYNRKYLEKAFCDLMESCYSKNKEFSLIIFDIDDFKGVNDRYGHQTGDEVLINLTKEIKKCLNYEDKFIRYGGEEFIILLPNKGESKAACVAEKIRKKVENAKILGEKREVTISLGVSIYLKHSSDFKELIKMADQALYISKAQGKNKTTIWNKNLDTLNGNLNVSKEILLSKYNKDNNCISLIKDIIELMTVKNNKEDKIHEFLSKIVTLTDSDIAVAFVVKNKKIINKYSEKNFQGKFTDNQRLNINLVEKSIYNTKGYYLIDWENFYFDKELEICDWKSLCLTPVIYNDEVIGVIYISTSVNRKEYTREDLYFINYLGQLVIPLFY